MQSRMAQTIISPPVSVTMTSPTGDVIFIKQGGEIAVWAM